MHDLCSRWGDSGEREWAHISTGQHGHVSGVCRADGSGQRVPGDSRSRWRVSHPQCPCVWDKALKLCKLLVFIGRQEYMLFYHCVHHVLTLVWPPIVRLSVFSYFIFFSRTTGPILIKFGTKHLWVKGIQACSNEEPWPFPSEILVQ